MLAAASHRPSNLTALAAQERDALWARVSETGLTRLGTDLYGLRKKLRNLMPLRKPKRQENLFLGFNSA